MQVAHDVAPHSDGVHLVGGQVVGQARCPCMHRGTAQLFVSRLLAGGHLHQWRATEEHLGALFDHDDVVAHAGHIGPAGGGVAEHDGHRGDGRRRQPGQVPERPPARDEQLGLGRQVSPSRLHQVDHRQPVLKGDVRGPGPFAEAVGVHGPTPDGGVVGGDQALDPRDHADADHRGGAHRVLGSPGRQRGELQKGGVPVDQELDALASQQLAPLVMPLHIPLTAAGPSHGQLLGHGLDCRGQGFLVGPEAVGSRVDGSGEGGHGFGHRPAEESGNRPRPGRTALPDVGRIGPCFCVA